MQNSTVPQGEEQVSLWQVVQLDPFYFGKTSDFILIGLDTYFGHGLPLLLAELQPAHLTIYSTDIGFHIVLEQRTHVTGKEMQQWAYGHKIY